MPPKKLLIKIGVSAAILVAGILILRSVQPKPVTEIMAWIYPGEPACNAPKEYSDGRLIDIIKPEYFIVRENGNLEQITEKKDGCNGFTPANLSDIKKYSKYQYLTVSVISVPSMDTFIRNELSGGTSIATLVSFVKNNNLEGIEIDFEGYNSWTKDQYSLYKQFISKLGNTLHKNEKKLMVDGPGIAGKNEEANLVWRYQDFKNLPVDKMVVLAYDYQYDNGPGNPVTPTFWLKNIIKYVKSKYIDGKISIGLPSYGYKGDTSSGDITLLTYDQIKTEPGFETAKRDPNSFEMTWQTGNFVYFYQDSESLASKAKIVKDSNIHSISIWHLGGNQWFQDDYSTTTKNNI